MSAIESAIKQWKRDEVGLHAPSEEPVVVEILRSLNRSFSSDVVALYCATGGMEHGNSDSHTLALWSLDRVVKENAVYARPHILFADFLIDAQFYCFKFESAERSSVWVDYLNGEEPKLVANSVEEFFESLVSDPARLGLFE